jgi:ABC-type Zn uptake system ZnuABC Zn-binding protein ZnuA
MQRFVWRSLITIAALSSLLLAASRCGPTDVATSEHEHDQEADADEMPSLSPVSLSGGEKLQVVATTSIVADVVHTIGGDRIALTTLIPLGTDPHAFEPTPRDAAAVTDAHVVFANGAGLEVFLEPLLESAGADAKVVPVSYDVELVQIEDEHEHEEEHEGEDREHEEEHEAHEHGDGVDPHTWFDPNNVRVWTQNIERALSALDPDGAEAYTANAETYTAQLEELDAWIREQVAQVDKANRRMVTDHTSLSYFVRRYGFEQVGAVFPGYSTLAEPSARELAALEDAIREFDVKAVFVGMTVNPDLAQRIADDTGVRLVVLYTGSLSEAGGPADDYVSFMRYNVSAIVEALH